MTAQKYNPPLRLDVPFDEALKRFAQTDPKETKDMAEVMDVVALPEISGTRINEDENGNICLNDLWRIAGEPRGNRPADWHRSKRGKALESALQDRMVKILHYSSKKAVG